MTSMTKRQGAVWVAAFILITGCIFFGAMLHAELQALLVSLLISLTYAMQGRSAKIGAPILLVSLLVVQNLAIGIGAHVGGNVSSDMSYLTQIPFVTCVVLFCSIALDRLDKPMIDGLNRWFWALVLWCVVMFIVGHGSSLSAKLVVLRNLTCWFMAFCVARAFLDSPDLRGRFYRQFGWVCAVVALLGFAGMALSWQVWLDMGLREVYIAKQSPLGNLSDWGGRFVTSIDGSHNVLRMLSTYYEPVNLAYLFSAGLICVASTWRRGLTRGFVLCLCAIGLFWSFGKGGWVVTGAAGAFLAMSLGMRNRGCSQRDLARLLALIIGVVAAVLIAYYLLIGGAVRPHFWAIERTMGNVLSKPLGHGLGTGGNAAAFYGGSSDGWLSSGGESALMSFAYQVGIPGALCLFLALLAVAKTSAATVTSARGALLLSLPFILLGVSLLQDNTFSPQCIVPFMLLLGAFSAESAECDAGCLREKADAEPCTKGGQMTIVCADLSIIVPAYNAAGTIVRCLDSLTSQGTGDFSVEIIVVDDGSTDGTAGILAAYASEHSDVRVVTVENGGPSRARNIGLAQATGRWVTFCDSDDWVDAGCYRRLVERAERLGAGVAVFGYKNVRPGSTRTHARRVARIVDASELAKRCLLDPSVQGFSWNKLYLRELAGRERFPEDLRVCEDLYFNIGVCERSGGTKVALLAGAPYNYDLTGESLTRSEGTGGAVMSVLTNLSKSKSVESAIKGAIYSHAVKSAFDIYRRGGTPCTVDFSYAQNFYLSRYCSLAEKSRVALRRLLICFGKFRGVDRCAL